MTDISLPLLDRNGHRKQRLDTKPSKLTSFLKGDDHGFIDVDSLGLRLASQTIDLDDSTVPLSQRRYWADIFWGIRKPFGQRRTEAEFRKLIWAHSRKMLIALPPLGVLVLLINAIAGLKPRMTRIAFGLTVLFWLFIIISAQAMLTDLRIATNHANTSF
jgi:hypothetical protein